MNVVIVGDSHSDFGGFGSTLKSQLEASGAKVTLLAIGGSAASSWLGKKQPVCRDIKGKKKCASLADVAGQKFDLAIIALGTNDAANANRAAKEGGGSRDVLMRRAIEQIGQIGEKLASRMIWVGPPKMRDNVPWYSNDAMDAFYTIGLSYFGDRAIDSRPFMPASIGGDGVHPSTATYKKWATDVAGVILNGKAPASSSAVTAPRKSGGGGFPVLPVVLLGLGGAFLLWRKLR